MKTLLILITGFTFRIALVELGEISWQHRFGNCVVKMHQGVYPDLHPKGGHHCLTYMQDSTLFEKISMYSPDLSYFYSEKIVAPKVDKAYNESVKREQEKHKGEKK